MNNQKGNIMILVLFAFGIVLFVSIFMISGAQVLFQNSQYYYNYEQATNIAEAGLEKAFASLNSSWGSYKGESETVFKEGSFSTQITDKDKFTKIITSTGYVPNKQNAKTKKTVSINVNKQSSEYAIIKGTYQIK